MSRIFTINLIAFLCGAAIMVIELVGSRVIAPYLGTSTFVWTSIIGVILASLSIGYWLGGRVADKYADNRIVAYIIFIAALFVMWTAIGQDITGYIFSFTHNIRISTVFASVILFVPSTIALGMVSPMLAKLRIAHLETSGAAIGNLYAISTVGSIVGTFLGGFFLISYMGTTRIFIAVAVVLALTSFIAHRPDKTILGISRIVITVLLILALITMSRAGTVSATNTGLIADIDTRYSRYQIYDHADEKTGREQRLITNSLLVIQSGMYKDAPNELLFEYTRAFDLAEHFSPNYQRALLIGAGGYSYPKHFIIQHPDRHMDVVEIDHELEELSKKYLEYKPHSAVTSFFEDGRTFLNNTTSTYDVIFVDAYLSYFSIPFQLTTREAVERMHASLNERGIIAVNVIGPLEGERARLVHAIYATYKSVFPHVVLMTVDETEPSTKVQNILLVAFKDMVLPKLTSTKPEFSRYLRTVHMNYPTTGLVLTDEFAPVEHFAEQMLK